MQHSPVHRRSPRLQPDATDTPVIPETPASKEVPPPPPHSEKPTGKTAGTHSAKTTKQVEPAKTSLAADVTEMQKQISLLKRQLADTSNKLETSTRQCLSLQNALKKSSVGQASMVEDFTPTPTSNSGATLSAPHSRKEPPSSLCQMPPLLLDDRVSTPNTPTTNIATTSTNGSTSNMATILLPPDTASASATGTAITSAAYTTTPTSNANMNNTVTLPTLNQPISTTSSNINCTSFVTPHNINSFTTSVSTLSLPPTNAFSTQSTVPIGDFTATPAANAYVPMLQISNPVYSQLAAAGNNFGLATPRKLQELPEFSGKPEDWPIFITSYVQSTAAYNYTNLENNQRLIQCLKGEARDAVRCLLIHPDNANAAVEQLRQRYGRPEQLIQSQLCSVRDFPQISEHNFGKIVPFATKVKKAVFLQAVNGQQHLANPTLLEELIRKLPMSKKLEWAKVAMAIQPYPTIIHFSDWVSEMASLINTIQDTEREVKRRVLLNTPVQTHCPQQSSVSRQQKPCHLCPSQHKLSECDEFKKFSVNQRWNQVKKLRVCFSCLNVGHGSRECRRIRTCALNGCQRKHHQLLHEDIRTEGTSENSSTSSNLPQNVLSCSSPRNNTKLLFKILPVTLFGENCQLEVFALFDDGSYITMLGRAVAEKLGVRGKNTNLNVQWFGGRSAQEKATMFNIQVRGKGKSKRHLLRNVYAVSNLNLPPQTLNENEICQALNNSKSRVKPYTNAVPQLLIGLDHAHLGLHTSRSIKPSSPIACNTKLGWVIYGPSKSTVPMSPNSCLFVNLCKDESLNQMVTDFFNIESIGVRSVPAVESSDDMRARKILEETTIRVGNRFQTGLLWKNDDVTMPSSYDMALRRLEGIERKMRRDEDFSSAYKHVVAGYIEKGYVRKVAAEECQIKSIRKWYLPHFGVINPNKQKRVRLVFDAAAQSGGVSLNSQLLKGPQDIELLPDILFNFRRGKIAVCADIREMFHQIMVQPEDRVSQRFLWREGDCSKPPEEYEMIVMTFGAACSPCSARFVLKKNALQYSQADPRSIKAIIKYHYIDDFVDSFNTEEQAIRISNEVRRIHAHGGFDLRGFVSNSKNVTRALDGKVDSRDILASEGIEKVLGIYWDCLSDSFRFHLKFHRVESSIMSGQKTPTKRELLSIIMSTFDPIGFLSCFIVGGKLILREIWRRECRWDEQLPADIASSWEVWRAQFYAVANFRIPRCYFDFGKPSEIDLHVFVDASEFAFAAVAYWRYVVCGEVHVSFVTSKTKCAPLQAVSIPRLELQAAVLGTRVLQSVLNGHDFSPTSFTLWSDSKTVLKWISSKHRRYKPYVAHRVAEILSATDTCHWKWISTNENVADEATRFSSRVDISPKSRWVLGPSFLKKSESEWQCNFVSETEDEDEEEIKTKTCLLVSKISPIDFSRFSSLLRLIRSFAWVLRFVNKCRGQRDHSWNHGLTAGELEKSEQTLIGLAQEASFPVEISCIKQGEPLPKNSCLKQPAFYRIVQGDQ